MTNQQVAPEALPPTWAQDLSIAISLLGLARVGKVPSDAASNARWRLNELSRALTALVEAQQPAAHVQNPGEIEHVVGDVSKNGLESNTAQQPAPSAAAAGEVPLPLLVRDIAADLGTTPIQVCTALAQLGFGGHSVNMAVTPRMAQSLRAHFASPTPQADSQPAPIDMVLHCPACGLQHIDASEPPVEFEPGAAQWSNPPHRSHLCHGCGHIWRPADVPTNGVAAVKTTGKADSPIAARAHADSVLEDAALVFTATHIDYVARFGGRCRDCADEAGVCPGSGLPCSDSRKAIKHVFDALEYGVKHGYIKSPIAASKQGANHD